jgi:sulfonate transport system permease protein
VSGARPPEGAQHRSTQREGIPVTGTASPSAAPLSGAVAPSQRAAAAPAWRTGSLPLLVVLLLVWEVAGRMQWVGDGALPAPSGIVQQAWADRHDYPAHIGGTVRTALAGFVIGNLVAVACGLVFVRWRVAGQLMAGINVTLFAMPAIALVPILVIALQGDAPRVVLAALSVYYPTMVATVLGLTQVDARLTDLVQVYGGRGWARMRFVQLRSGLPTLLAGLRVAAPAAVLGSLLAEFGSGGSAGLGTYLIGSLGRADPARLWGIGLAATAISGLAYLLVDIAARRFAGNTLSASTPVGAQGTQAATPRVRRVALALGAVAMPFLFWWAMVAVLEGLGVSEVVLRTPPGVFEHLFTAENAADNLARLADALAQTLPYTLLGMAAGLAVAFVLAVATTVWPGLGRVLLPFSLVTQSMPLVALTPLVVLVFGRDTATILVITVSVTFFPAFVTIAQGLALVPPTVQDCVRAYGGGRWRRLQLVAIPWSVPYLCAAARLAAPRAFLGVMIAEWLATGTGVGNLLNESRGMMDFGMIWSVAVVAIVIAVALNGVVALVQRFVLRRYAMDAGN